VRARKRLRTDALGVSYTGEPFDPEGVMPSYDYRCRKCGQQFTTREKIAEHNSGAATCPECKSQEVERVMSSFYAKTPRKS
jgi:putative FmdB family regulatory protein